MFAYAKEWQWTYLALSSFISIAFASRKRQVFWETYLPARKLLWFFSWSPCISNCFICIFMSTHRHSISLMRYAGRIDQIVLFGYVFQCLKNYSKRPCLRKTLGCMLQKQQVQTQVLSTNCSRISGCLNYLIISKLHFKTVDKKRFLLVCRQANWNHKALYENWLGIFFLLFCWSVRSCEQKNSSLTKQPTGEILHLQSIASAFVSHMVYSPSNISSYDYLRKQNCMFSFSKIPLFIQRKKKNSEASELLLNKTVLVETLRNYTSFLFSEFKICR